ncbi:hypothetical protein N7495_008380 [Penicillium taxi]|uniref:uncharacterized protein n=1 Tax=Penicillium taxi TaxID=168475 RepID=UPI0025451D67|nr:uncharacterized protein N7495_008380 [Penicillium taxi]KAJ5888339.1 hypothetical protein N7495_008380 [Penicillium taxi]
MPAKGDRGEQATTSIYYKELRNLKGRVIGKALRKGFCTWISQTVADGPKGLWKVNQSTSSNIPALKDDSRGLATSNQKKAELLQKVFFPELPEADLSDLPNTRIPDQIETPAINKKKVMNAINRAPPDKAPGKDGIPNRVRKILAEIPEFLRP